MGGGVEVKCPVCDNPSRFVSLRLATAVYRWQWSTQRWDWRLTQRAGNISIPGPTVVCDDCQFRADVSFFTTGALHPTPKEDEDGWYVEFEMRDETHSLRKVELFKHVRARYYIDIETESGRKYLDLLRVANAETVEELPEDLVNLDVGVRLFAQKRLETLRGRKKIRERGTK